MTSDFRPRSHFLSVLVERGFLHQCSDLAGLDQIAKSGELVAYIGFDCTAPSLHAGSLVQIMLLRWLQLTDGKPIALMGGGTTRVGDPSGKDASRQLLPLETIAANKEGIKRVFARFLNFGEGKYDAIMLDNADWLATLNYIDFLREVGRHFSLNQMLAMDSVKLRLDLSFLEFNYMCLQAYDFVELFKRHGCKLQMGGSDQWGNIATGIDLGRRMGTRQLYGLTSPLLTTASGAKMGKTGQGAVWLDENMLPVFEYWQYWRNCEDRDTGRFLRLFTELPLDEIARLEALGGAEINEAKKVLATEATAMVHGREKALQAADAARKTFVKLEARGTGTVSGRGNIHISEALTAVVVKGLPTIEIPAAEIEAGLGVLTAFVRSGLVASTGEARRQIIGGGLKINDRTVTDERMMIGPRDLTGGAVKLSLGRKRHVLLKVA
ncbi:MAG: tyrosine--tRNA ligase [Pseudomonadota bacterium]|nr:tyrosine--tRNA ligase [Pseudomonadota bacterium]